MHKRVVYGAAPNDLEAAKMMYRAIAGKEEEIQFVLNNGDKVSFEKTSNGCIRTRDSGAFTRTMNKKRKAN